MKSEMCLFSGYKIHPGHGRFLARVDGKTFWFLNGKVESLFLQRKNPYKIAWTVLYRRKHKKGIAQEKSKRKTRKTVKFQRAIAGVTREKLLMLRNQKPEVRQAQREQALRAAKEKKKKEQKKTKSAQPKKQHTKGGKQVNRKAAPRVGGLR
eukprot:m.263241 g.263241  ORF g.263241 m.263241 type:complete len:152 (-) comp26852_c0_seq1:115-570(-)